MTYRIIHGDCLEVMAGMAAGSVDAVVTDPPYGIGIENHGQKGRNRTHIAGDEDMAVGYAVLEWAERRGLPTIVFASPRRLWAGDWRNLIVWDKGGAVGGGGDLKTCLKLTWELIQVARNGPLLISRDTSVWYYTVTQRDFPNHPCEKPVGLMEKIITTFIPIGATVLDPFCGSGTTGVACIQTGRNFIGIEIDEGYCKIAERRCAEAAMQGRLF